MRGVFHLRIPEGICGQFLPLQLMNGQRSGLSAQGVAQCNATPYKKGLGYEYEAKAARAEANYREAKAAYDKLTRSLPDQTRAEVAKVRIELEKAVNDFYAADPKAIDANTMELLRSGILKPAEYARLFDAADNGDNATMCRLIAQAAENGVANAKDENDARQLRYIANRGRNVSGKPYMDAFDSLADTLDRSLRRPYLIKSRDELTANILENF